MILGGPEAGEYHQVASVIAGALREVNMAGRAVVTEGSVENLSLLAARARTSRWRKTTLPCARSKAAAVLTRETPRRPTYWRWLRCSPSRYT